MLCLCPHRRTRTAPSWRKWPLAKSDGLQRLLQILQRSRGRDGRVRRRTPPPALWRMRSQGCGTSRLPCLRREPLRALPALPTRNARAPWRAPTPFRAGAMRRMWTGRKHGRCLARCLRYMPAAVAFAMPSAASFSSSWWKPALALHGLRSRRRTADPVLVAPFLLALRCAREDAGREALFAARPIQ